jgi:hypothetical protein
MAKPWAVILCKFSDQSQEPHPADFYKQAFTEAGAGAGREFEFSESPGAQGSLWLKVSEGCCK